MIHRESFEIYGHKFSVRHQLDQTVMILLVENHTFGKTQFHLKYFLYFYETQGIS
jgi:hypothetical protein